VEIKMNENPELTFTVTLNEANAILAGLQELPGKVCNPLSQKITEQAKAQIEAMQATAPEVITDVVAK
jgi:hypothetical protein